MKHRRERRTLILYWAVVGLCAVMLGWWMVFFSRLGTILVHRLDAAGAGLSPSQAMAVHKAVAASDRMLLAEGSFLVLLLLAGVYLVLRSMRHEIELHRRQRDFLSAVTHELRSPIASARLHVESLRLGRVPEAKRPRYLQNAQQDLERLTEMVDRLLDTARTTTGRTQVELEPLDLADVTRRALERIDGTEEQRSAIALDAPAPVPVRADADALGAILRNLVSNALKYGGDPPRIEVHVSRLDGEARLEVRDHGPGLRGTSPKRVFEPFVRGDGDAVRGRPGVGLGLYLVAELARAQGGRVRARNVATEGGGFSIELRLPLSAAEA